MSCLSSLKNVQAATSKATSPGFSLCTNRNNKVLQTVVLPWIKANYPYRDWGLCTNFLGPVLGVIKVLGSVLGVISVLGPLIKVLGPVLEPI